jgi:hypothetical protein
MEKLTMCAKILYDRDVIEKNKENKQLKNELRHAYSSPKIVFKDRAEWSQKIENIMKNIQNSIDQWIDNEFEHSFLKSGLRKNLTARQRVCIALTIEAELNIFTNRKIINWCYKESYNIIDSCINPAIFALNKQGKFDDFSCNELAKFVYNIIEYYLGTASEYGLLYDISYFNCEKCGKMDEMYVWTDENSGFCFECFGEIQGLK